MSARNPALHVIEVAQDIRHCPMNPGANGTTQVPNFLLSQLFEAYDLWLDSHTSNQEAPRA